MNNLQKEQNHNPMERRKFVSSVVSLLGISAIMSTVNEKAMASAYTIPFTGHTVQDIINLILKEIPGAPFKQTVDTLKSGNPGQQVTGIVTTMFATVDVIKQAANSGANFIIAHEPSFYNHLDDVNWVQPNHVLQQKQELLNKYKMAVWRFHDYWHSHRPDGIMEGVITRLGWKNNYDQNSRVLVVPPVSLKELIVHIKEKLGISSIRVIGDTTQVCKRIALLPGAAGGQQQIRIVESEKPDTLICGEVHEWETAEYIRDARALGGKTSLLVLGHAVSEEPGMSWLVKWLQPRIPEIPVTHIASKDPFFLA